MLTEHDYNDLIDRLAKQRIRLMATKDDMRYYVLAKFGTSFNQLNTNQIIELGMAMKEAMDTSDLFLKLHGHMKYYPPTVSHTTNNKIPTTLPLDNDENHND